MFDRADRSCFRNREGFTLTEVVVSSAIMTIVFLAMLATLSTARRIQAVTEKRQACLHVAREMLETLQNKGYDSSDFGVGTYPLSNDKGQWTISQVSGERTKDVTVVVNWTDLSGAAQTVSLTSSFSRSLHR